MMLPWRDPVLLDVLEEARRRPWWLLAQVATFLFVLGAFAALTWVVAPWIGSR